MCDQETKELFGKQRRREWTNTIMLTVLLAIAGWMATETYNQGLLLKTETGARKAVELNVSNHLKSFDRLIALIPDGFFTKQRYGINDALVHMQEDQSEREALRRIFDAEIKVIDKRLQAIELSSIASMTEANVYKKLSQDNAKAISDMQKVIWKIVPNE